MPIFGIEPIQRCPKPFFSAISKFSFQFVLI
jgi:hypothetical protein